MFSKRDEFPLVSIIIPVYNGERYLADTLNSAILQTYPCTEIILVNDNSSDRTQEIIDEFASINSNIRSLCLTVNSGGPAVPRNHGLDMATGEYVAFLDADDLWHPRKLELQMLCFRRRSCDAVCSVSNDAVEQFESTLSKHEVIKTTQIGYQATLVKSFIPLSSLIVRTSALRNIIFSPSKAHHAREDYLFCLDLLSQTFSLIKLHVPLVNYRKHDEQISKNKAKMLIRQFRCLKDHLHTRKTKWPRTKAFIFSCTHLVLSIIYRYFLKTL